MFEGQKTAHVIVLALPGDAPFAFQNRAALNLLFKFRDAAQQHRTGDGVHGPKPDGVVRDFIEVLLGTARRPGRPSRCGDATSSTGLTA